MDDITVDQVEESLDQDVLISSQAFHGRWKKLTYNPLFGMYSVWHDKGRESLMTNTEKSVSIYNSIKLIGE